MIINPYGYECKYSKMVGGKQAVVSIKIEEGLSTIFYLLVKMTDICH